VAVLANLREADTATWNLEVENEHVYRVGPAGILVHNTCPTPKELFEGGGAGAADSATSRVKPRKGTLKEVDKRQPVDADGDMIDPNTGQKLKPGEVDLGHKPGQEWRKRKAMHEEKGSTRKEVLDAENDPDLYQWEDRSSNRSHRHEQD
jgi:hypothetical protein